MGGQAEAFSTADWVSLRRKIEFKVRHHVGYFCSDVEDLVQETLARFQRALNTNALRKPESVGAFLNGICKNVILEYRRGLWREIQYEAELHPEPAESPAAYLLELRNSIDAVLEQLGDRDRQVLTAFYLQERDKDEICRALGVTDAQFRIIIFRAKDRFRRLLSNAPETPGRARFTG
jgi:RNA polymerase sigma-70 factor (ECF subfamily)